MTMVSGRGHAHEIDLRPGRLQVINTMNGINMGIRGDGVAWSATVVLLKKMKNGNPPGCSAWPNPLTLLGNF
jgi:hypothetical protein